MRAIKDAGSMKIASIRESGSHAASKARKTVASGMVQVCELFSSPEHEVLK